MPAGDVSATMVFKESLTGKDLGWSETHYLTTISALDAALAALYNLAQLRARLLGAGVLLQALKVSDVSVWRDSDADFPAVPRNTPVGPVYNPAFGDATAAKPADFGYSSLLVRLEALRDPLYRRSMWLSGNPDVAQTIERRDARWIAAWDTAYTRFKAALLARVGATTTWGFRVKSREAATTFPTQIQAIDPVTGLFFFDTLDEAFQAGRTVQIYNVRGFNPRPAGSYLIIERGVLTGGQTSVVLENVGPLGGGEPLDGVYTGTGYMRLLIWKTVGYGLCEPVRFGSRDRGGPFGRAVGRRKTRKPVL